MPIKQPNKPVVMANNFFWIGEKDLRMCQTIEYQRLDSDEMYVRFWEIEKGMRDIVYILRQK